MNEQDKQQAISEIVGEISHIMGASGDEVTFAAMSFFGAIFKAANFESRYELVFQPIADDRANPTLSAAALSVVRTIGLLRYAHTLVMSAYDDATLSDFDDAQAIKNYCAVSLAIKHSPKVVDAIIDALMDSGAALGYNVMKREATIAEKCAMIVDAFLAEK